MEKVDDAQVVVSIQCLAYNHEKYIRQCLDGFVMQKTSFRFEAIVHDDASTDGTAKIIKEYADKYPDIIKPIYETENQYSRHNGVLQQIMNQATRGKYVAICEGDDYWTDPYKLQKQVDFLECHSEYVMCFTGAKVISETHNIPKGLYGDLETREYKGDEIILRWRIPTCTVMFNREIVQLQPIDNRFFAGDIITFLTCVKYGRIYCLADDITAVYRQNAGGWIATHTGYDASLRWLEHYKALLEYFPEFTEPIRYNIMRTYARLFFNRIRRYDIRGIKFLVQGISFGKAEFLKTLNSTYKEWRAKKHIVMLEEKKYNN